MRVRSVQSIAMTRHQSPAISYVEVLISMFLIGGGLFSGIQLAGSYVQHKQANSQQAHAEQLAQSLMAEILSRPRSGFADEPNQNITVFPIERDLFEPPDQSSNQEAPQQRALTRELAFAEISDFAEWQGSPICSLPGDLSNYFPVSPNAPLDPGDNCQPEHVISADFKGYRRTVTLGDQGESLRTVTVDVYFYQDFYSNEPPDNGELVARVTEIIRNK